MKNKNGGLPKRRIQNDECQVCCELISSSRSSKRCGVICAFCGYRACVTCVQRYILSTDEPECMSCKRQWTQEMVERAFSKSFLNGKLKLHREDVLLNRERALLPDTQPVVRRAAEERRLRDDIARLQRETADARRRLYAFLRGDGHDEVPNGERRQFVKPCPAEGCRGFLSTQYKCGLCAARVCPDCHEITSVTAAAAADSSAQSDQQHVCPPDALASVRAIQSDSKPCPKCGSMIFRIHGCNQMFCTAPGCNTAFCWRTLNILSTQSFHNPHYYEYMRQRAGREIPEGPCGGGDGELGMPSVRALIRCIRKTAPSDAQDKAIMAEFKEVFDAHRFAVHVQHFETRRYPAAPDIVQPQTNQDLRIRFLNGQINEKRFKEVLQQREKCRKKKHTIHQILVTVANVSADIYRRLIAGIDVAAATGAADGQASTSAPTNAPDAVALQVVGAMEQMAALRVYSNDCLNAVSKRFDCVVPNIESTWATPLRTMSWRESLYK